MKQMFDKKLKNILAVLLLVLFVVSLTASAVNASSTSKSVSLYYLQLAATSDPARPQGGTTPGAVDSVKIVEAALVKAGFLADNSYAKDGSYGTATIKAYKKWQKSLGSAEKYCDGIPGKKDLTKLGNKYGFTVDMSTPKPVAAFSASPTSGKAPLKVQFTDKSIGTQTNWKWTFGDGTTSTSQSPKHTYSKAGKYTVSLTVKNAAGSDTETKSKYIIVKEGAQDLKITDKNLKALNQGKWAVYDGTSYPSKLLVYDSANLDVPYQKKVMVGEISATTVADYEGYYWGECVSFGKTLSKSTTITQNWIQGRNVVSSGNVKSGTVIATFGSNGKYLNKRGYSHTAIFREYVRDSNWKIIGFSVWDQNYVKTGIVGRHDIRSGTKTSEATNYYVVQV
jgi:PKD repeat protein